MTDTPSPLSEQRLREIEQRCAAAWPRPWVAGYSNAGYAVFGEPMQEIARLDCTTGKHERERDHGEFIAHARQDLPDLLAEVHRLRILCARNGLNPDETTP